jgi:alpha-L-fucosidase
MLSRREFLQTSAAAALSASTPGPLPSQQQLAWSKLEYYNFLHFTVNTFTDREWGNGDEDPNIFNPTAFDADAICETLRDSGSKGVILTCKHHDGFCLWPTKTTDHCIRSSKFRNGKGDIVKDISEAARRHGLKFGVYLSPWDRNQGTYGTPQYIDLYRRQMHELLTGYGELFEIWHDGANGGSGYYGGAKETRTIDKLHYYDWAKTWQIERELQPNACRFSDAGPDIRWVGNEKGIAGETCWATFTPHNAKGGEGVPGDVVESELNSGTRFGKFWMPAECDVSIRPGWFWHEAENAKVKTPQQLLDLHLVSVGRGASFLLNVPPDRRGLIHENDAASLRAFGKLKRDIFSRNLAAGAKREGLTLTLPKPQTFNLVQLREDIAQGQRVAAFNVEYASASGWKKFGAGTSIGMGRILRSASPVTTDRIRLQITETSAPPVISDFALFNS